MDEQNVLSPEEVEALIQAAQTTGRDVDAVPSSDPTDDHETINTHALNVIIEATCHGIESKLTALLRRKVAVKASAPTKIPMKDSLATADETQVYSSFVISPYQSPAMILANHNFLDNTINLLYGGKPQPAGAAPVPLGKIGLITAEKINQMIMDCIADAAKEYGAITHEHYKTSTNITNMNNIPEEEEVFYIELKVMVEEIETKLGIYLTEECLIKLLPVNTGKGKHRESDFWRTAIKSEVVDSFVTVTTTIADVQMKIKDFLSLKEGEEVPIVDPTLVYVCLNNLKLFKGLAGQSNSKVVVKIVSQV